MADFGVNSDLDKQGFEAANVRYLTTEQILEDYVELVDHIKSTVPKAANCPVLAFGGSYGGTLTTFLRAKYPATVIGGLAASAPIGYYDKEAWATHGGGGVRMGRPPRGRLEACSMGRGVWFGA